MHLFQLNVKNCQTQTLDCNMGIQMLDSDTSGNMWVLDQLPQQVISFLLQTFQAQFARGTQYVQETQNFSIIPRSHKVSNNADAKAG